MHTSVEKRALRIATAYGTLAHASLFNFFPGRYGPGWPGSRGIFYPELHGRAAPAGAPAVEVLYNHHRSPHSLAHPKHIRTTAEHAK
jgi:hypothetical protein